MTFFKKRQPCCFIGQLPQIAQQLKNKQTLRHRACISQLFGTCYSVSYFIPFNVMEKCSILQCLKHLQKVHCLGKTFLSFISSFFFFFFSDLFLPSLSSCYLQGRGYSSSSKSYPSKQKQRKLQTYLYLINQNTTSLSHLQLPVGIRKLSWPATLCIYLTQFSEAVE